MWVLLVLLVLLVLVVVLRRAGCRRRSRWLRPRATMPDARVGPSPGRRAARGSAPCGLAALRPCGRAAPRPRGPARRPASLASRLGGPLALALAPRLVVRCRASSLAALASHLALEQVRAAQRVRQLEEVHRGGLEVGGAGRDAAAGGMWLGRRRPCPWLRLGCGPEAEAERVASMPGKGQQQPPQTRRRRPRQRIMRRGRRRGRCRVRGVVRRGVGVRVGTTKTWAATSTCSSSRTCPCPCSCSCSCSSPSPSPCPCSCPCSISCSCIGSEQSRPVEAPPPGSGTSGTPGRGHSGRGRSSLSIEAPKTAPQTHVPRGSTALAHPARRSQSPIRTPTCLLHTPHKPLTPTRDRTP